jgi:hypothetical protein
MPTGWKRDADGLREHYARRANRRRRGTVTVAEVRAEGVLDVGRVPDTSILFAQTRRGLRLFHAESLRMLGKR